MSATERNRISLHHGISRQSRGVILLGLEARAAERQIPLKGRDGLTPYRLEKLLGLLQQRGVHRTAWYRVGNWGLLPPPPPPPSLNQRARHG